MNVLARGAILIGVLAAGSLAPGAARAQSLLGAGTLGFPLEDIGARSRGMGSLGVGLMGSELLPTDPASSRGLRVPMITATYQPTWSTYEFEGVSQDLTASRFPLLGLAYPVGATGMATVTFSAFLDQNWEVTQESTLTLSDGQTMDVVDHFTSTGGISVVRLGWAQAVHERVGIGVSVGSYLGDTRRVVSRVFEPGVVGGPVNPFQMGGKWRYTGPTVTLGASWDPSELLRVAGSAIWSGDLHAEPVQETTAPARDIDIPTQLRLGVSGSLSARLSANVGVGYADWTATSEDLVEASTVGAAWSWGGGLEWEGPQLLGRNFPLRAGYRHTDLPFRFDGSDPTESTFSVGLGLNLLVSGEVPLAAVDMAWETGTREAGSFSESFGRGTFTVRVAGG